MNLGFTALCSVRCICIPWGFRSGHRCARFEPVLWAGPFPVSCQPSQWARSQGVLLTTSFQLRPASHLLLSPAQLTESSRGNSNKHRVLLPAKTREYTAWGRSPVWGLDLTASHPQWLALPVARRQDRGLFLLLGYIQRIGVQGSFWTNHNSSLYFLTHNRIFFFPISPDDKKMGFWSFSFSSFYLSLD